MKHIKKATLLLLVLYSHEMFAQFKISVDSLVYKRIDGFELKMFIYKSEIKSNKKLPAIVFFFAGGWNLEIQIGLNWKPGTWLHEVWSLFAPTTV